MYFYTCFTGIKIILHTVIEKIYKTTKERIANNNNICHGDTRYKVSSIVDYIYILILGYISYSLFKSWKTSGNKELDIGFNTSKKAKKFLVQ